MLVLKYLKTNEEFSSESQAANTYYTGIEIRCRPKITELAAMLKEHWAAWHKNTGLFSSLSSFVIRPYHAYQKKMMT